METVRVVSQGGIARITLNRPEVRNAFNETLIRELTRAFGELGPEVRVVILTGEGKAFCAGADLKWMQESVSLGDAGNAADAAAMATVFRQIDETPRAVICRLNGPAIGGGLGLVAACDLVVTIDSVKFAFSEVRLGVVPAVISPFVLRRLGPARARRWFVTGELFGADEGRRIGLVDEVAPAEQLDAVIEGITKAVLRAGPRAVDAAKRLVREVEAADSEAVHERTAALIASLRVGAEGQEGLRAFLEKREPRWP